MTVARYAVRRAALKAVIRRPPSRRTRDCGAPRVRNRDGTDGRPRGYLRAFGLSRVRLREQTPAGYLPGVRKSSR
ncbi:30S ribosomal protein S14 [Streptomyces sp. Edi2]|uniref:30S ribosomal protein S14 n=1 Tax=Streptomyces sp. Edi2 TaxID=3162528 RepID=UPI00330582AF